MPETPEPEFVALLAIDWADRKHVFVVEDRNGRRRRGFRRRSDRGRTRPKPRGADRAAP